VFFNDSWRAYVHDPNDPRWTRESYASIGIISCVDDFWALWNACNPVIDRTMLFIMREHVFPSWDDPACIDGAIGSAIVPRDGSARAFRDLVQRALGECLVRDSRTWSDVNGVSIAPKNGFCVLKVWMNTPDRDASRIQLPDVINSARVRYQPCRKHIEFSRT
jgi:hypothetical protein